MLIEACRSVWRTPAGCYVGRFLILARVDPLHPAGVRLSLDHVSTNIAPRRGAIASSIPISFSIDDQTDHW